MSVLDIQGCERNPFAYKMEISVAFSNLETIKNLPVNTFLAVDLNTGKLDPDRNWWFFASGKTDVVNAVEQTFKTTMGMVDVRTNRLVADAYLKLDRIGNTYKYFGQRVKDEFEEIETMVRPFVIDNINGNVPTDHKLAQIVYKNLTPLMWEKVEKFIENEQKGKEKGKKLHEQSLMEAEIQAKKAKLKKTEQPEQQSTKKSGASLPGVNNFPQCPVSRDAIMEGRKNLKKVTPKESAIDLNRMSENELMQILKGALGGNYRKQVELQHSECFTPEITESDDEWSYISSGDESDEEGAYVSSDSESECKTSSSESETDDEWSSTSSEAESDDEWSTDEELDDLSDF